MSPPEVWGPAVWTLFHTLIEKMNPDAYPYLIQSLFNIIVRICKVLPCPECSKDATIFLAKINIKDYKTKLEFKNMLYLFHNWVNAKKRKPLYNYANMNKYANLYLPLVINDFIAKYNTKGNMKLLTESFQRTFVVKDLIKWFKANSRAFIKPPIIKPLVDQEVKPLESIQEVVLDVEQPIIEEPIVDVEKTAFEETIVDFEKTAFEEPIVEVEKTAFEEPIVETEKTALEEPIVEVEKTAFEETIVDVEKTAFEEHIVEVEKTAFE